MDPGEFMPKISRCRVGPSSRSPVATGASVLRQSINQMGAWGPLFVCRSGLLSIMCNWLRFQRESVSTEYCTLTLFFFFLFFFFFSTLYFLLFLLSSKWVCAKRAGRVFLLTRGRASCEGEARSCQSLSPLSPQADSPGQNNAPISHIPPIFPFPVHTQAQHWPVPLLKPLSPPRENPQSGPHRRFHRRPRPSSDRLTIPFLLVLSYCALRTCCSYQHDHLNGSPFFFFFFLILSGWIAQTSSLVADHRYLSFLFTHQIRPSPKTRRSGQADPSPPTATLPPSTLKPCAGRHPSHHPSRHLPALVFPSSVLLPSLEQGPRCIHPDRDSCKSRWSNVTQFSKTHRTLYPSSPPLSDNLYERRRLNRPRKASILLFIPLPLFCLSESLYLSHLSFLFFSFLSPTWRLSSCGFILTSLPPPSLAQTEAIVALVNCISVGLVYFKQPRLIGLLPCFRDGWRLMWPRS
ncbi:hypothetical protein CPSG_06677 [Coccidioides posadasii str. Silveira]|uniref:Uncharacterized protein n=1 Tax=Coccidioides posadasii (strain RMSCC 757 / Silveira) TaxID=443226 RepID=E9D9Y7_COCPS|nr:hypothetical protein CPSG_06677 [Coccidioides posadasii str. Silveira]